MEYKHCTDCGDILCKEGVCQCKTMYALKKEDKVCPECGSLIYCYNDPSRDNTLGEYCTNANCDYLENQFMDWEDIKGDR